MWVARLAWIALALFPDGAHAHELTLTLESANALRLYAPTRFQKSQNRIGLDGEVDFSSKWQLHADGWLLYDPVARLVGSRPDFGQEPIDRWQVGGGRTVEAELRELYLDGQARAGAALIRLRVGKQQVVWGQSFGLRILDIVNPQEYREFILDDFNRARTPTFGVRVDVSARGWEVQGLLMPDFEPDVLPDFESEFALEPTVPGILPRLARVNEPLGEPLFERGAGRAPDDWTAEALGYGLRVGTTLGRIDVSLYYWDRPDARAVLSRRIEALPPGAGAFLNRIIPRHPRVRSYGAAFATVAGDFSLWGEGALTTGRAFTVDDLSDADGVRERTDLQYAIGLDWNGWDPLFANLQLIQLGVLDHEAAIGVEAWRSFLSLLARFDFRNETLFPQLFALYGVDANEWMLRPSIEWKVDDRLTLSLGADVFTGPRTGLLGQYAHDRKCAPVPSPFPAPDPSGCYWEPQSGRPSRVFLSVRYAFSFGQ